MGQLERAKGGREEVSSQLEQLNSSQIRTVSKYSEPNSGRFSVEEDDWMGMLN